MSEQTIYVFKAWGAWHADINDGEQTKRLTPNIEQIHSALAQNGWVRVGKPSADEGVGGVYVHSKNWPLDQSPEPLAQYYA